MVRKRVFPVLLMAADGFFGCFGVCIGIVGRDLFGGSFSQIGGRVIKTLKKKLALRRYGFYDKIGRLGRCRGL